MVLVPEDTVPSNPPSPTGELFPEQPCLARQEGYGGPRNAEELITRELGKAMELAAHLEECLYNLRTHQIPVLEEMYRIINGDPRE